MAHLNVTQPSMAPADRDGMLSFAIRQPPNFNRNPSTSYAKSSLSMRLSGYPQHQTNPPAHHETVKEVDEPLTAIGGYSVLPKSSTTDFTFSVQNGGQDGSRQQSSIGATPQDSQQGSSTSPLPAQSPYNIFPNDSSRTNSAGPSPGDQSGPVFANSFTQEPTYDDMSFAFASHPAVSPHRTSYGSNAADFPHSRNFSLSYGTESYSDPTSATYPAPEGLNSFNGFNADHLQQQLQHHPHPHPSFNSFLHAPAPLTPSSSLAGALIPPQSVDGGESSVGWPSS